MSRTLRIGLALGSGGARGLAHVGVLEALTEAGIRAEMVSGTSMGAIVGGLYAENPDPTIVWEKLLCYVNDDAFASSWSAFVPRESGGENADQGGRLAGIFDFMQRKLVAVKTVTRFYQQSADRLREPLENLFGTETFEELELPLATVALDLIGGESVVTSSGSLVDGLYGSCAIPAIFPPIEQNDMMICDGGGPFRLPVEACRGLGADFVIGVDIPAFEETKFSTGLDMILRSNTVARQRLNRFVCQTADLIIRPEVTEFHWADFGAGEACRARGYAAARDALPTLRELLRQRQSRLFRLRQLLIRKLGLECAIRAVPEVSPEK